MTSTEQTYLMMSAKLPDEPTSALQELRRLVQEKTRFEPSDLKILSDSKSAYLLRIRVRHELYGQIRSSVAYKSTVQFNDPDWERGGPQQVENRFSAQKDIARKKIFSHLLEQNAVFSPVHDGLVLSDHKKYWSLSPCVTCRKLGKVTCRICSGSTEKMCSLCAGQGYKNCIVCSGTGRSPCIRCGGAGGQFTTVSVFIDGQTTYQTQRVTCGTCAGLCTQNCIACGATGKFNCHTCYCSGKVDCTVCEATGAVMCRDCLGSGEVGTTCGGEIHLNRSFSLEWHHADDDVAQAIQNSLDIQSIEKLCEARMLIKDAVRTHEDGFDADYTCELSVYSIRAECNRMHFKIVAYGQPIRWLSLDNIFDNLLQSDLNALNSAVMTTQLKGWFSLDYSPLANALQNVCQSEMNTEIVEATFNSERQRSVIGLTSTEYQKSVQVALLSALQIVQNRIAKRHLVASSLICSLSALLGWMLFWGQIGALFFVFLAAMLLYNFHKKKADVVFHDIFGTAIDPERIIQISEKKSKARTLRWITSLSTVSLGCVIAFALPSQRNNDNFTNAPDTSVTAAMAPATELASAPKQSTPFQRVLGLYQKGKHVQARQQALELAQQGNAEAAGLLAFMQIMQEGLPVGTQTADDNELKSALDWAEKGLTVGSEWAMAGKGMALTQGWGAPRNTQQGLSLLKQAAWKGHVYAMYAIGMIHVQGQGVRVDHKEARKWFQDAAKQNHAQATYNLGLMDSRGDGIDGPDRSSAMRLWARAAELGDERARDALRKSAK